MAHPTSGRKPKAVKGRKYSTFNPGPASKGYKPADVLKLGPGQVAKFTEGLGYYAAAGPVKPKPHTTRVVKPTTESFASGIESPEQIEERVKRMASESFASQQKVLNDQADRLRREAEGRRLALQGAYAEAAKLNAGFGADVQDGWNQAAQTITGLAGTATGGVKDALLADLATQEQALSRVGAGGTGFDATSQGDVEYFRGGGIPGEYDGRMGGIGRQWMNEAATALNDRGLQEGIAAESVDRGKINADLAGQIGELTAGRSKYESDLREQLLGSQSAQLKAQQDQREFQASMALKRVQIEQAQQKINLQYQEAKLKATTSAEKLALDQWYKQQNVILDQARIGISQQNADAATTSANASATRAANAGKPGSASPASKRVAVATAQKNGKAAVFEAVKAIASKTPNINQPVGWDEDKNGKYINSAAYATAKKEAQRRATLNFGSIMYRTINVIGPFLKEIGYTQNQIKRMAYNLVSPTVDAPRSWLQKNPGYGPKV